MTHPEGMPSPDKTANSITLAEIAEQKTELDNIDTRLERQRQMESGTATSEEIRFIGRILADRKAYRR